MRKTIYSVAFILCAVICTNKINAQPIVLAETDPNAPEIKFETDTLKYGLIENGSDGCRTMKFKNVGKTPLIIQDVRGDNAIARNGDTKTWAQEPVAPGKWGVIKVYYDTKRTGPFVKYLYVESNAKQLKMRLIISGKVKPPEETELKEN
ncbi:MAG: DUF1573 domain-containing protein [Bacteroidia bacterium]|nr:DUF1573 domain-containing protein [Bacteroidia bacterium]